MSGDAQAVGVDVGGTKLTAATLSRHGDVLDRRRVESPTGDPDALVSLLVELVEDLDGSRLPVGVGVAGIVDPAGVLEYGPNLAVENVPLGAVLAERLGTTVTVKNDATTALYAEYRVGAGEGADHLLMITLGTGVGGALVVGGELVEGAHGFAGELGHLVVVEGGRACPCGNLGCLEAYASGTAIGRRARQRLGDDGVESSLRDLREDVIVGKQVAEAALAGDRFAEEVLTEAGTWLGIGLASIVNVVDPERIVVGGGAATTSHRWVLPAARESMAPRILGSAHRPAPTIVLAQLGDDAGMIGAGLLALHSAEPV